MVLMYAEKQSLCGECWSKRNPDTVPHVLKAELRQVEVCCDCGIQTSEGLYMRLDPGHVRYPRSEEQ